jgi:hypothetical protein
MSETCNCGHERNDTMDELVLKALKAAIEQYPEIIPYLKGQAAKIVADGVERHQKIPPRHEGEYVYTPGKTEITQEDIDEAIAEWDRLMPEYAGMLDAEVRIDEDAE